MTTEQTTRRLVIDRATWRWGGDELNKKFGPTRLLNRKGFKCCLGFDALDCGTHVKSIRDKVEPIDVATKSRWGSILGLSEWTKVAINLNDDDRALPQPKREAMMTSLFKSHPMGPVELVFEGEYPEGAL